MKKLLRAQDKLLLGLEGIIDLYEILNEPQKNAYRNMYGWDTYVFKKSNLYDSVYFGLRIGNIEKVIVNGKPFIQLTNKGREKVSRKFSIDKMQVKKWDGKWRAVIFDIEEKRRKSRDLFRRKLRELGFGMIQESVWVSPYDFAIDFRDYIESINMQDEVFILEVSNILAGNPKKLAEIIWHLEELNSKYSELYERINNKHCSFIHDRAKNYNDKNDKSSWIDKDSYLKEYLDILKDDPCLPEVLLPEDWYGKKVKKLLKF